MIGLKNSGGETMKRSIETRLSELYISNMDIVAEGLPDSVNSHRRELLETFNLLGLPNKRVEEYRHCDMQELHAGEWEHYFTPPKRNPERDYHLPIKGYSLEALNGYYIESEELTRLDNGIIYGSLSKAILEDSELVMKYYNQLADNEETATTVLNSLFMQDGTFIYIPKGVESEEPFILTFDYESEEEAQMCFARTLIVLEEGAKAEMMLYHHSDGKTKFLVNHVRELFVGEGAELNVSEVSNLGEESSIIFGSYQRQGNSSDVNIQNLWFDGKTTRVNAVTDLDGTECDSLIYGLMIGTDDERTDINIEMNHLMPNCHSDQLIKGLMSGSSVGAFTGKIFVAEDAQQTLAFQQSSNLLLSEKARIYSEPQLEIYADDVKCSHGATLGELEDETMFYMQQRGLSEEDARRLQLIGFADDVISHCPLEDAREFISNIAIERIKRL